MIRHEDEEFYMVKHMINAMVDYLIKKPSPLAWVSDGEGDWTRPKAASEIKTDSLCFAALENRFKKEVGVDFAYSWNDFYWAFRDEWTWRTSP